MSTRRTFMLGVASLALSSTNAWSAAARDLRVYKTSDCTCCEGWVTAMSRAGFRSTVVPSDNIVAVWRRHGIPDELSSCHLGIVEGYVVVGHVPPADVLRLLKERPKAIGLTVPGMPVGSPGMEIPGVRHEAYETRLITQDGKHRLFARHS